MSRAETTLAALKQLALASSSMGVVEDAGRWVLTMHIAMTKNGLVTSSILGEGDTLENATAHLLEKYAKRLKQRLAR